jgi:hypothetical protein
MNLFPDNFEEPSSSDKYMKLQDGENKLRIISQFLFGWEDWNSDKKPIRYEYTVIPPKPLDSLKPPSLFIAFVVWNYAEEKVQILCIKQATIRKKIRFLCDDTDWGSPFFYDIKIIKKGTGKETSYDINPLPHKELDPHIINACKNRPCKLEALIYNGDPFAKDWKDYTKYIFSKADLPDVKPAIEEIKVDMPVKQKISFDQLKELSDLLAQCDPEYHINIKKMLAVKPFYIEGFENITTDIYPKVLAGASKNAKEYAENPFTVF